MRPYVPRHPTRSFPPALCFVAVIAALINVSSVSTAQWTQSNGPYGGYVYSLGSSGSYLLAGTHGKGAYRSSDYGASWTSATNGLTSPHVYSFLTYGSNLFAACPGGGGVCVSTNDGSTWTSSNSGLWNYEAYSLARIDTDIFVATMGGGVFRSTDEGANWLAVNSGLGIYSIWRLTVEGNLLLAGTYGGGLYLSSDHGESWTKSDTGITNSYVEQFAVSDSGIFAGTFGGGVFRSTDHGAHWSAVNGGPGENITDPYIRAFLAVGTDLYAGTDAGIFLSTNNGGSWSSVNSGLSDLHIRSLIAKDSRLVAGGNGGGCFVSIDGGSSWTAVNTGLNNESVVSLSRIGATLLAGSDGTGVFRSTNNGVNWTPSNSGLTQTNIRAFAVKGPDIFAGTYHGVFRSGDSGATWSNVTNDMLYWFVLSMAAKGSNVFAGTSGGVLRSSDDGAHWSVINSGLSNPNVYALLVSGDDLYAGTSGGGVFRSTDDGDNWSQVNNGLTNNVCFALASMIDGSGDTVVFAGTGGSGVFQTTDNGATWVQASTGLGLNYLAALAVVGSNILAAGPVNGIYVSSDRGANWSPANTGLLNTSISSLVVAPDTAVGGILVAGTVYGSAWRRPLWQIISLPIGYPVRKGWNLVSLPLTPDDAHPSIVYPTATSNCFAYQGSYVVAETLAVGTGYWEKFDHDHRIPIAGTMVLADTIDVAPGWNMIGSISAPVPVASIVSDPPGITTSRFFSYEGVYITKDTLQPGIGYWVKASQAGEIVLQQGSSSAHSGHIRIIADAELPPTPPGEPVNDVPSHQTFALEAAYPNPFNPVTRIHYEIPELSRVRLAIYDLMGRLVDVLVDQTEPAGARSVSWDASGNASGVYFCRIEVSPAGDVARTITQTNKIIYMR